MQLPNTRFLPRQPVEAIGAILSRADVLLVHLKDDPLFRITIPSKTQAYLAVGRPVLMAVAGDAADLVVRSGGGIACPPENPAALAAAVRRLGRWTHRSAGQWAREGRSSTRRISACRSVARAFERMFEAAVRNRRLKHSQEVSVEGNRSERRAA